MLTQVIAGQLVLRFAVDRSGQRGELLPKRRTALIPRRITTDIDEERFGRQRPRLSEHRNSRIRCLRVKTPAVAIPVQSPAGEHQHQLLAAAMLQPIRHFVVDPHRLGGLRGQHHDQVAGAVQPVGDVAPQVGAGRQIRVIAKHPQRPQLTQPPPDTVQPLLKPADHRPIIMVIRQERVVIEPLARPPRPQPAPFVLCQTWRSHTLCRSRAQATQLSLSGSAQPRRTNGPLSATKCKAR